MLDIFMFQQKLHLKNLPRRIECFDISNIQGKDSVASMVVMENNQLLKKDYRKYKIKTVSGIDDTLSMREALQRRWKNYFKAENYHSNGQPKNQYKASPREPLKFFALWYF